MSNEERRQGERRMSNSWFGNESSSDEVGRLVEKEILDWIEKAQDPKDKAMLMILYRMNSSLSENTKVTKAVAIDFTEHKDQVNRILNMAKGGYLIALVSIAIVQALSWWILSGYIKAIEREVDVNALQEHRITDNEGNVRTMLQKQSELDDSMRDMRRDLNNHFQQPAQQSPTYSGQQYRYKQP